MKWRLMVSLLAIVMAIAPLATAQDAGTARDRLVGAWKLVELDRPGADGSIDKVECTGMFVFARDGHLEVQVMESNPKPSSDPEQYSVGGYEASFGSYTVDETARTFNFHVEGALARNLIGKDLPRAFAFDGNRLIVKSVRTDEHWRVVWERY